MRLIKKILQKNKYLFLGFFYLILHIKNKKKYVLKNLKSSEETLSALMQGGSICRYGDGEFGQIFGYGNGFQKYDKNLDLKLSEILQNGSNTDCMIAIPNLQINFKNFRFQSKLFWAEWCEKNRYIFNTLKEIDGLFFDSLVTRPYIDKKNKSESKDIFDKYKNLFRGKNILIVEGAGTNFGIGNNLLEDTKDIKRIICPNTNAFSKYDEIFLSIKSVLKEIDMLLIALGPTATVLCWELSKMGVQCIDIGHLDIEYEWYRSGAKKKSAIQGKNINELGLLGHKIKDNKANGQIIDVIN